MSEVKNSISNKMKKSDTMNPTLYQHCANIIDQSASFLNKFTN